MDTPAPSAAGSAGAAGAPASVRRLLDALEPAPAFVIDRCWDLLASNAAVAVVFPGVGAARRTPERPRNVVESVLADAAWRASLPDWWRVARMGVDGLWASLISVAADETLAARATALVTQLTAASPEFRTWWPEHGLWVADQPVTHLFDHPSMDRLKFDGTMLDVRSSPALMLLTDVPCDRPSAERLRQLLAAPPTGA